MTGKVLNKTAIVALACLATGYLEAQGQCDIWTTSTIRKCNGTDYELWNQNNRGTVTMKITGGATSESGGTFEAAWSETENILFRAGKKWGASSTTTARSVGAITLDFAATWTSSDNVKMLGVYGWAYYPSGSEPTTRENGQGTAFSNQIEYYIIQDRGSFNPASGGANGKKHGEATIDGIAYEFWVADRINQPMLTGSGNFKQYFSVPKNAGSHRQSGLVTISRHFEEWDKAGMKMLDCRLYEIAMKVESYTGSANGNGSAKITKNVLTLGDTPAVPSTPTDSTPPTPLARNPGRAAATPVAFVQDRLLNVRPVDGVPLRVRVRDVTGASWFDFTVTDAATFPLSDVPAGRYVLEMTGAEERRVASIVLW